MPAQIGLGQTDTMRIVTGKHIVLKSDGGTDESLRELVDAFDAAVPQWAHFLQLPPKATTDWKIHGFIITNRQPFLDSGDLPLRLNFPYGYATHGNIWVMRQPSAYYTRHLLLHEGVHALFLDQFNNVGPSWFAEGLAETLGVHRDSGSDVQVNVVPRSRAETPYWGRFKLLSESRTKNQIPTINAVMGYPQDMQSDVESYGWCWIATMLLTQYPEYHNQYLAAATDGSVARRTFNDELKRRLQSQWPIIEARWRMLTQTIDYGFDWRHERIDLSTKDPIWEGNAIRKVVQANRGWQSLGVRFRPGTRIQMTAAGQCVINETTKPWISEPAGVTIQYANDRPLGQLMVCILPNRTDELRQLKPPQTLTLESKLEFTVENHCWILLRINDHLDARDDNRDGYTVNLKRQNVKVDLRN